MKKYHRIITDLLPKKIRKWVNKRYFAIYLRDFLFIFFVLLIGVLLQLLVILNGRYMEVRKLFFENNEKYYYWNSVASQFPYIPDILYNAALSSFAVGKGSEAMQLINKAIQIDPLFEEAVKLRNQMRENK
ncbi:MAG: hypothetical protein Q7T54_02010 [Candidatus Levybacteria bacterium]|nr:hypothetical protein [Candidatus Levybacteria bacterium]